MPQTQLICSPEVQSALAENRPVVALESTIIAHGMPYPQNAETAFMLENTIREHGAVPATCAVRKGMLCAGLSPESIDQIAKSGHAVPKASRRDLPYLLSQHLDGATTVASTMMIAHLAGIRLFATGGIGGVHRGAETTMDISADLPELARTPVAVVSAGAKSILDIGLTLEYLETLGVPVIGYSTHAFPAFYTRESGWNVNHRLDSPEEIARLLAAKWQIEDAGGVLIANPVPEAMAMDPHRIESAIREAIRDAGTEGISGKALTPFLLARIERLTGGDSLQTNIALALNNAKLAAAIARCLSAIAF